MSKQMIKVEVAAVIQKKVLRTYFVDGDGKTSDQIVKEASDRCVEDMQRMGMEVNSTEVAIVEG